MHDDGAGIEARGTHRMADPQRMPPDAPGSATLDELAALASRLLGAPTAQVSLISDVQSVVASAGTPPGLLPRRVDDLDRSLCDVTVRLGEPLVVTDAPADARVADRLSVVDGTVGSYLGVPLTHGGADTSVGALCVFGPEPREWSPQDVALLRALAGTVAAELELAAVAAELESSRLRWGLAVDAAGVGTFDWDLRSGRLAFDDRLVDVFGFERSTFEETFEAFNSRLHPDDLPRVGAAVQAAIDEVGEYQAEYRITHPQLGERWVRARGRVLGDQGGGAARMLGAAWDTTAEREGDTRVARVLEAMPASFCAFDREWRYTHVNAAAERLLGRSREELLGGVLWDLFPGVTATRFEQVAREAMASGRPAGFEEHYPSPLDRWCELLVWPGPDGVAVYSTDVTERRSAQERADRTAQRLALLADVTSALTETLDGPTAVARLARLVVPALGDACIVTLVEDDGSLRDVGWWHADPDRRPVLERYAQERLPAQRDRSFLHTALRTGRTQRMPEPAAESAAAGLDDGPAREALLALAPRSGAVLPLRARGRTLGALTVLRDAATTGAGEDALATAEEVASRAGLALDNARLYAQQRALAERLQRSLLTEPPAPDHAEVAVRYTPAARTAQVGGDWYDAFLLADGATVLVIGDVVGHDTAAAVAMGQLRGLLRGIAYSSGAGPAAVLGGLDAAMRGLQVDTTATAAIVRLEQSPQQRARGVSSMRWSNAGHPPPMVVDPEGRVAVVTAADADLLLGIDPGVPRQEHVLEVDRGATVLLYTDGLVERRDQSLGEGLDRLREALSDLAALPLGDLCDALLARLLPEHPEDDVALVAVRLHRQDRPRPAEAGPHDVPPTVPADPAG